MERTFTPKQVARAIGVSDASLKRWCDKGLLDCQRTAGGHRRIPLPSVMAFLREADYPLVRPEILGLPANAGTGPLRERRASAEATEALLGGDEERLRAAVLNLFLSGEAAVGICDRVLTPAYNELGNLWAQGEAEVYRERRAGEMCLRVLHQLRDLLPPPGSGAPLAVGGSPDPYAVPTTMVEVVLRELGWRAVSFGAGLPLAELRRGMELERPRLFWLSVSDLGDADAFLEEYERLYAAAVRLEVAVVVGGRALGPEVRARMRFAAYGDRLEHLAGFVGSLGTREVAPR